MIKSLVVGCLSVLITALTACGGGGGDPTPPVSVEPISRVEIVQTGLILTATGSSKALKAVAYGASGGEVAAAFTWKSTRTDAVTVNIDGTVTSQRANGSALVTAEAQGISSAPLLVAVTAPPVGALLLTDDQIVGEPVETDASATPNFANTYRAVLTGVQAPSVGTLVINTDSKAVAGRVVAVTVNGAETMVTLSLVSLREMFPALDIDELIDLGNAFVEYTPDIAARYDIARAGNTFSFTPKTVVAPSAAGDGRAFRKAATGTRALPPFSKCETSITGLSEGAPLPIALSAPPLFSVTINPKLSLLYTSANGLERFVVSAEPTVKVEGGVAVAVAFEGKVECSVDLFTIRIPVGGPLSFVVGGLVPVGVGIEAGGKVTLATLGIGTKVETKAKAQVGFACPGGTDCSFVRSLDGFSLDVTPTITTPSLANLRVEPSIAAFGTVKAAIGNPFFKSLRFEAVKVKAGGKLEGSFAPQSTQLLDAAYKSDYKLSLEASAGVGADLSGALSLLGLAGVSAIELKISTDLATSPAGLATGAVTTSISRSGTSTGTDPARFQIGDSIGVTVKLDPATTTFLGIYNVSRVLLVRNSGGQLTELGRVVAATGQTEFSFSVLAADAGSVGELSAFTVTALLPLDLLALEAGTGLGGAVKLQLSTGRQGVCAVRENGTVMCWGANGSGELGIGTPNSEHSSVPVLVTGIDNAVAVSEGFVGACALLSDGTIKCWGEGREGELGNGHKVNSNLPVSVVGINTAVQVSYGIKHSCAVLLNGTIRCWGFNFFGALGDGTTVGSAVPVEVIGITNAIAVQAAENLTCALLANGTVKCWGERDRLGSVFPNAISPSPLLVTGIDSAVSISASAAHTCAVLASREVKCWGGNRVGQLGDGTTVSNVVPVSVKQLGPVASVAAGYEHTCALLVGGEVYCWGSNRLGRLGNGTIQNSSSPVKIVGPTNVTSITSGSDVSCITFGAGSVQCWGENNFGALGDGTNKVFSSTPVPVAGFP